MDVILQTLLSNHFLWKVIFWFKCHWNLYLMVQLTRKQHWFRLLLDTEQATDPYMNQWWSSLLTHTCVTRPQWGDQLFITHWISVKFVVPELGMIFFQRMRYPAEVQIGNLFQICFISHCSIYGDCETVAKWCYDFVFVNNLYIDIYFNISLRDTNH